MKMQGNVTDKVVHHFVMNPDKWYSRRLVAQAIGYKKSPSVIEALEHLHDWGYLNRQLRDMGSRKVFVYMMTVEQAERIYMFVRHNFDVGS